jgi:hypothetical protein
MSKNLLDTVKLNNKQLSKMGEKTKYRNPLILVFVVILAWVILRIGFGFAYLGTKNIEERFDNRYLADFAKQIKASDHIEATTQRLPKVVSLSLSGADVKRVVQAVSDGKADRQRYSNMWEQKVVFFSGTNKLGEILLDAGLFMADGKQYKDSSYQPNANGGSGILNDMIYMPLVNMEFKAQGLQND